MAKRQDTGRSTGRSKNQAKRDAQKTKSEAKSAGRQVKQDAKHQAKGMKQQAKKRAEGVKQEAKQKAKKVGQKAKSRANRAAESQKGRAANKMHSASDRLDQKARRMEAQGGMKARAGKAAHRTGDAIDQGADYLQTHQVSTIRDDLGTQIRQHPFLSVGAALGSGLLIGSMMGGEDEEEWLEEHPEMRREPYEYEARPAEPPREHDHGMMNQLKGQLGKAVVSGVSAMVAKKLNDRVRGPEA